MPISTTDYRALLLAVILALFANCSVAAPKSEGSFTSEQASLIPVCHGGLSARARATAKESAS